MRILDINNPPYIGQPCTVSIGSDSYPYTVVRHNFTYKRIWIRACIATPAEGHDYYKNQVYDYSENFKAGEEEWSLRKDGQYRRKGESGRGSHRLTTANIVGRVRVVGAVIASPSAIVGTIKTQVSNKIR